MKYSTIEIRWAPDGWYSTNRDDPRERVASKKEPHACGFFHYPTSKGPRWAFTKLKKCIVEAHKAEIARLQKSLESLQAFGLDETTVKKEQNGN